MRHFDHETHITAPRDVAFAWHAKPGAFERLLPPWQTARLVRRRGPALQDDSELHFKIRLAPGVWHSWHARHFAYRQNEQFADEQVRGPFSYWTHYHRFEEDGPDACVIRDEVEYLPPGGMLGNLAPGFLFEGQLRALFRWREHIASRDIALHHRLKLDPHRIALTGANGLIGRALTPFLTTGGHEVVPLQRRAPAPGSNAVMWDPMTGIPEEELPALEGIDAVVHLAGESILGLWTKEKKKRIRDSRVIGTRRLCEGLARLERKPRVLISASAVGFYGNRGDETLTEEQDAGEGFLADVAREWEAATESAREAGIRVVHLRFGMILDPRGGALGVMKTPFTMALGGRLGSGHHMTSWISVEDVLGIVLHAIATESLEGPVNAVSPFPVTNAEFTETLAETLRRPAILPVPEKALRTMFGDAADEVYLTSVRAVPKRLLDSGFEFAHRDLGEALELLLGI